MCEDNAYGVYLAYTSGARFVEEADVSMFNNPEEGVFPLHGLVEELLTEEEHNKRCFYLKDCTVFHVDIGGGEHTYEKVYGATVYLDEVYKVVYPNGRTLYLNGELFMESMQDRGLNCSCFLTFLLCWAESHECDLSTLMLDEFLYTGKWYVNPFTQHGLRVDIPNVGGRDSDSERIVAHVCEDYFYSHPYPWEGDIEVDPKTRNWWDFEVVSWKAGRDGTMCVEVRPRFILTATVTNLRSCLPDIQREYPLIAPLLVCEDDYDCVLELKHVGE